MTLRFLTGGESHGRGLLALVEGLPSGLPVKEGSLSAELARRRRGFGRGPGCSWNATPLPSGAEYGTA